MIKANELRIGNSLLLCGKEIQISAGFIADYEFSVRNNFSDNTPIRKEDVQPIPITEERLVRLGFVKSSNTIYFSVPQIKSEIHFENFRGGLLCVLYSSTGSLIPSDVKYIHQLQNLIYALTVEELTANDLNK